MLSFLIAQQGSEIAISLNMSSLLILFMLPPAVGVVKSVVQTIDFKRLKESPDKKDTTDKKVLPKKKVPEKEVSESSGGPSAEVPESTDSAE